MPQSEPQSGLVTDCLEELEQKSRSHKAAWQLGEEVSWSIDQTKQTIIFYFADGRKVSAPVQIIGTYDIEGKKLLWGWANRSIHTDLTGHSEILRDHALKGGLDALLQELSPMSEQQAWRYTALVVKMTDAFGAYRGQIKGSYIFMTFGSIFCDYEEGLKDQFSKETVTCSGDGKPVQRKDIVNFVQSYFAQLFSVEQAFHQQQDNISRESYRGLVEQSLRDMVVLYDRHWQSRNELHKPCAVSWPSDYDLGSTRKWKVYDLGGDVYRVTYIAEKPVERRNSLYIRIRGDDMKIIDFQYDSCDTVRDRPLPA